MKPNGANGVPRAHGIEEAIGLFEVGIELMRSRLRREDPGATDKQIDARVAQWLHSTPESDSLRVSEAWTRRLRAAR